MNRNTTLFFLILTQALDVLTTFIALHYYGIKEGNPAVRWVLANFSWVGLIVLKTFLVLYLSKFTTSRSINVLNIIMGLVVVWNILNILVVRALSSP